jgi:AcrR family transcriptional regulator
MAFSRVNDVIDMSQQNSKSARGTRIDSNNTRARFLDVASQIFPEYGYTKMTSKENCAIAKTNTAAVNYYFGGKNGLYSEVLAKAIANSTLSPKEKLEKVIDSFFSVLETDN